MAQTQVREVTRRRRRVRVGRVRDEKKQQITNAEVKLKLDKLTRQMRDADDALKAAQRALELASKDAFETMQAARLDAHSCAEGDLKIKVSSGRSSTYIPPKEYHELVDDDEFYGSISVSVTKAKEHLSGKEIEGIAVVTPAVPGAPALKWEFYRPEEHDADE